MSFGVSLLYTVEEYGKYNFAYTLSNAVVLLIDSFTFIIFPKMIDRLKSTDVFITIEQPKLIRNIRV